MKVIFFFLFPLLCFAREVYSDKAVFRVAEEIVFKSDLEKMGKSVEALRCLKTDGILLDVLMLSKKYQPKIPNLKTLDFKDPALNEFIQKIIVLIKADHYIETQSIILEPNLKTQIEKNPCINKKYSDWPKEIRLFFDLEIYVHKRFVLAKEKGQKGNMEQIKESVKIFLNSIAKKIPHYVFY